MEYLVNLDKPRTAIEIARRVIVLHCVIAAAHGVSKQDITEWLNEERLWDELTPHELKFMKQEKLFNQQDRWRLTWFAESQLVLLWSIGKLNEIPSPTKKCDTKIVVDAMPGLFEETLPFINSAIRRSDEDIENAEENIYDIHCRVGQAIRKGEETPEGYDSDVVYFRHYGLAWVTGYLNQSWDQVTPDT